MARSPPPPDTAPGGGSGGRMSWPKAIHGCEPLWLGTSGRAARSLGVRASCLQAHEPDWSDRGELALTPVGMEVHHEKW